MHALKPLLFRLAVFAAATVGSGASPPDGKIHLSYWEKWSGKEEYAMQQAVNQFNRSQDRIVVDFLSVGDIGRKTIMATAGGDPPDIAGVYLSNVCSFADRNALTPLDGLIRDDGSTTDQFLGRYAKAYASMGLYQGQLWAVPSTPTTCALYWNKDMFRAAGLDPERPPRTLAELDAMSEKLAVYDKSKNLLRVGFLPQASSGWIWAFPAWFGGGVFDGKDVTIGTNPANLTAFRWMAGYTQQYGVDSIRHLTSSFGLSLSPQDPFMTGQVAMIFDGVWRSSYIRQFAPGLKYGVAGWPEVVPGVTDFTVAESDMLVIPRGAKHPREAWAFIKYMSSPNLTAQRYEDLSGIELACFLQEKASPLTQWSPYFEANNPDNRDLKIFRDLAESPHAEQRPKIGIGEEYQTAIQTAFDQVRLGIETPEEALAHCQARMESSWRWNCESLARRQKSVAADPTAPHSP